MNLHQTSRLLALVAAFAWAPMAMADEALWKLLQAGGQVVLMRHALTTPGVGDPDGMTLDNCASQRNLSEEGRGHARQLAQVLRARGVPVGRVLASPWCRCIETAGLALGSSQPERTPALGNLFGRPELRERQLAELRPLAGQKPAKGNTFMVSHGSTIVALTGISPDTAEMVVLTPQGGGRFTVAGRMLAHRP
ncbi:MAG: histidine phosphatase family protein [Comamonadaceae bacterium]|nr:MAG: histidine phosphatase family protein [Comamonadaceae bacterium]